MIKRVVDNLTCYGCTSCASVCPRDAIKMIENAEGFKYPEINENTCVECGLCEQACPALKHTDTNVINIKFAYAAKHNDKAVLENSTSGGVFTALSDYIFLLGGVVYGAAFDKNMVVRHIRADNAKDRDRMRGSKYVQSDMGKIYASVKADLRADKFVLFTGTPCQVDGLKRFLNFDAEKLVCVDLICYGVPSPKVLKEHFMLLEQKNRSKIVDYKFRSKRWSWHIHREIAVFKSNKELFSNPFLDLWRTLYYMRWIMRPSCHMCSYSNLNRSGDLTFADCRGVDNVLPEFGSENGASLVFVNTEKGQKLFDKIRGSLYAAEVPLEKVIQPPLREPSRPNSRRDFFWQTYLEYGYKKAIQACFGKAYTLKYYIKKFLGRT